MLIDCLSSAGNLPLQIIQFWLLYALIID